MPTPIIDALKDDSDFTMHTHTETDLGATLDSRYVNVTGDTMTGALVITPSANGTSIFNVTNQAGASVFKVNTTDLRSETTGAVMAIESASGYSQFNHANALTSAYPRAFFNIFGGASVTNAALYVASGNATGSTQIPAFLGISTNSDVKQADSIQAVHYLTTSAYKIVTTKGESGSNTVPVHIGGTSSSLTDSKVIISTNDDPIMSVSRTVSVGTSTSFLTLYAVSTTFPSALFWKSDQPLRLGTATSTAGSGFSEKMRIDSSGNVGIGTTAPAGRLHINGTADDEQLIVEAHSTQTANILEVHNSSSSKLAFITPTGKLVSTNIGAGLGGLRADLVEYGNTAGEVIYINRTITGSSVSGVHRGINLLANSGNIATGTITALDGLNFQINAGTTTVTTMKSYNANLTYTAAGTITNAYGFASQWAFNANATITNLAGFYMEGINASTATVTNAYGLLINSVSGATNNFAIQTNAGNVVLNEGGDASTDFRVESDTEANMLFVDANANTDGSVYLGGTTNGIEIKKGGDLTLLGTAKYERHVQIPAMLDGKVANQPTSEDFFTAGGLQFASTGAQYAYCQWEIPDDWDGTDVVFEVDWFPDSGAISGTDAVRWTVEYRAIAEGELINNGTSVTVDNGVGGDTTDYAQYETKHSRFTLTYNNANQPLTTQDHVYFKISRDTSVANDFAGTVTVAAYEIIYQSKGLPSSN